MGDDDLGCVNRMYRERIRIGPQKQEHLSTELPNIASPVKVRAESKGDEGGQRWVCPI